IIHIYGIYFIYIYIFL
ncbi:polysaccharide biosynthesis family protein, partial [Vibrio cholerae HC-55B2]